MSKYYEDVMKQPGQLVRCLQYQTGNGKADMQQAFRLLSLSKHVFIVAIGASWNAALAVQYYLNDAGVVSQLCDASEFYHHILPPSGSAVLILSRSGKSIEIVQAADKCSKAGAAVIAITNDPGSPLAGKANICLHTHVEFDHAISINTYSSIILTGYLLAQCAEETFFNGPAIHNLEHAIAATTEWLPRWEQSMHAIEWPLNSHYYFLARGASVASAFETALLWQEAAKYPATAMSTGTFRHGPQEIIDPSVYIVLWLEQDITQQYDWRLAADLQQAGAQVLVIGAFPEENPLLHTIPIPAMPSRLDPLINIMPLQLAAARFAHSRQQDCDQFRYCSLVVEKEGGL